MSFGRKTYDGDIDGRSSGFSERRNTIDYKSKIDEYAPSKRAAKKSRLSELDDTGFNEESERDRYLITYSDLITLLLGLFIILYASSNVDALKYKRISTALGSVFGSSRDVVAVSESNAHNTAIDVLKSKIRNLIKEYGYRNTVSIEETKRGIIIHILDDILFPSGNAELSSSSILILNRIAPILKEVPNDIRIEGHTDNVPIHTKQYPSNWHLSVNRALKTAYYLINNEDIVPARVSIVGCSKYKPIADNSTASGREKNRRVDIVIIKSDSQ